MPKKPEQEQFDDFVLAVEKVFKAYAELDRIATYDEVPRHRRARVRALRDMAKRLYEQTNKMRSDWSAERHGGDPDWLQKRLDALKTSRIESDSQV